MKKLSGRLLKQNKIDDFSGDRITMKDDNQYIIEIKAECSEEDEFILRELMYEFEYMIMDKLIYNENDYGLSHCGDYEYDDNKVIYSDYITINKDDEEILKTTWKKFKKDMKKLASKIKEKEN